MVLSMSIDVRAYTYNTALMEYVRGHTHTPPPTTHTHTHTHALLLGDFPDVKYNLFFSRSFCTQSALQRVPLGATKSLPAVST